MVQLNLMAAVVSAGIGSYLKYRRDDAAGGQLPGVHCSGRRLLTICCTLVC